MNKPCVVLDTNIVMDFLHQRGPYYASARLLMICGRVGEIELWLSASQMTDLVYLLSNGGRKSEIANALEVLRGLRTFVNVYAVGEREIDLMLATNWQDAEDYLVYEIALALKADFIVTRSKQDFPSNLVKAGSCEDFFEWLERERGITYGEETL